jgi:hypothetical protein
MNSDFHFYGTGTAAMAAGLNPEEAKIVANAAEFVDYFIGDYYWSYWDIVPDSSWLPKTLFEIDYPQLTAQSAIASALGYYSDYWVAFHFPPGNKQPVPRPFSGQMAKLQERYLQNFELRNVNSNVQNKTQLCRPYSQFVIDMINDTIQKYQAIKTNPNWKNIIASSISSPRYIGNNINRDTMALIFLGLRMHVLADTWAHQDFSGFDDKSINRIDGDVYADVYQTGRLDKAPYSAITGVASGFFTGGIIGGIANFDTDIVFAPQSGCGHGNFGHYADYGWLNIEYPAAWRVGSDNIKRNNPDNFIEAWNEIAAVIAICLNNQSDISMPGNVVQDIITRFDLSSTGISASSQCENGWAADSGCAINNALRWKDNVANPCIGVTHGLAATRWGHVWIQDGSILHMYELAALMHFSWCEIWTKVNPGYNWKNSSIDVLGVRSGFGIDPVDNCPHIFSIGTDNTLYLNSCNESEEWSGWMANWNNAPKMSNAFGVECTDNCPHIFGIGTDYTLYLNWRNGSNGVWSGWMADWNNAPKLLSVFGIKCTDNCPYIFGIGTDNTLYLNWFNGDRQWSGWMANWNNAPKLSGVFGIETTDNCPHMFGIGIDKTLYLNWRDPSGVWSGWMANWNNAPKLSSVFGIETTDNCPYIFGIGIDNTLYLNWRNQSSVWSGWIANWNNAPKFSGIFGIETTDNCPHMFGIGIDNTLYLNWRNPSGVWSGWMDNWCNAPKLTSVFGVETTDNCPLIYGIGVDNTLYLNLRDASGQWSGWLRNWNVEG